MADRQAAPNAVTTIRVFSVSMDVPGQPVCATGMAEHGQLPPLRAIWRNEVGQARCTAPQACA